IADVNDTNPKVADVLTATTAPGTGVEGQPVPAGQQVVTPNVSGSTITSTPVNGISVDGTGQLTGTPTGLTWSNDPTAPNYETQTVTIPVTVTNGTQTETVDVLVTVQR
ncbi:hypothetical protein BHU61_13225, partial [Macrococcus epidermidis]